jgi:diadenosine tetraphosphate (Ap4A) HIT family hydrolase
VSAPSTCLICERIARAKRGDNATLILEMESGLAVLGDNQFLRGYCLLLAREHVQELHDLSSEPRRMFLRDMAMLGEAVSRALRSFKINYAMLGNTEPHLHCHVHARYREEPEPYRRGPITMYPKELRDAPEHAFSIERDAPLISAIRSELLLLSKSAA